MVLKFEDVSRWFMNKKYHVGTTNIEMRFGYTQIVNNQVLFLLKRGCCK